MNTAINRNRSRRAKSILLAVSIAGPALFGAVRAGAQPISQSQKLSKAYIEDMCRRYGGTPTSIAGGGVTCNGSTPPFTCLPMGDSTYGWYCQTGMRVLPPRFLAGALSQATIVASAR